MLKDEYINLWFPEASRDLGHAGIEVSIEIIDQQPTLKLIGRQAMLADAPKGSVGYLQRNPSAGFWNNKALLEQVRQKATAGLPVGVRYRVA